MLAALLPSMVDLVLGAVTVTMHKEDSKRRVGRMRG